ncbi:MAG: hypothetical protein JO214_00695 [Frankiaceae bacterium]|nr:hypothetical protein [Frankiaceae bacterium]
MPIAGWNSAATATAPPVYLPGWWAGVAIPALRAAARGQVGLIFVHVAIQSGGVTADGQLAMRAAAYSPRPGSGLLVPAPALSAAASAPQPGLAVSANVPPERAAASAPAPGMVLVYLVPAEKAAASAPAPAILLGVVSPAMAAAALAPRPGMLLGSNVPTAFAAARMPLPDVGAGQVATAMRAAAFMGVTYTITVLAVPAGVGVASMPQPTIGLIEVSPAMLAAAFSPRPGMGTGVGTNPASAAAFAPAPGMGLTLPITKATAAAFAPAPNVGAGQMSTIMAAVAQMLAPSIIANQTVPIPNEIGYAAMPSPNVGAGQTPPAASAAAYSPRPTNAALSSGASAAQAAASAPAPIPQLTELPPPMRAGASMPTPAIVWGVPTPPAIAAASAPAPGIVSNTAPTVPAAFARGSSPVPNVALLEVIPPMSGQAYAPAPQVLTGSINAAPPLSANAYSPAPTVGWVTTAVSFDAGVVGSTSASGGSATTWTHTVASQNDRLVLVYVGVNGQGTNYQPTSVTFGGTAMTLIWSNHNGDDSNGMVYVYLLWNPTAGANTVSVTPGTFASQAKMVSLGYYNVQGIGDIDYSYATSGAISQSMSGPIGSTVLSVGSIGSGSSTWSGVTAGSTTRYNSGGLLIFENYFNGAGVNTQTQGATSPSFYGELVSIVLIAKGVAPAAVEGGRSTGLRLAGGTVLNTTLRVPAGFTTPDVVALVFVSMSISTNVDGAASVTIGGQACTQLGILQTGATTSRGAIGIYALWQPPVGTNTVAVTTSGGTRTSTIVQTTLYRGVGSIGAFTSALANSITVPTSDNSLVSAGCVNGAAEGASHDIQRFYAGASVTGVGDYMWSLDKVGVAAGTTIAFGGTATSPGAVGVSLNA